MKNTKIFARPARIAAAIMLSALLFGAMEASACTSVIISGKATKDGRPLMWKNTDGRVFDNRVIYSDHKGYPLMGMAGAESNADNAAIWVGHNIHGFAIMNTVSNNIKAKNKTGTDNGRVMRVALERCKTVEDFKKLLDTMKRVVSTNYGVIDAQGGAAYFETWDTGYYFKDVNDPAVAPDGWLVYANFSLGGVQEDAKMGGYMRYQSAIKAVSESTREDYSPQWIFNSLSRNFYHSLMKVDFKNPKALALFKSFIPDGDCIPRRTSTSAFVVHGVKPGENPELSTLWGIHGYPPCSIAVPSWVSVGYDNSAIIMGGGKGQNARICDMALVLKADVYSVRRGNGQNYLEMSKVFNPAGTGYMQQIAPIEQRVFEMANPKIEQWRAKGAIDKAEAKALAKEIDSYIVANFPKK